MTNYRNYRIRTIAVPNDDGKDDVLEVVSMETLATTIQSFDGGMFTEEKLYFVCFKKQAGEPKKLYVVSAETEGQIKILRYEVDEFGSGNKTTGRGKGKDDIGDNNPGNSEVDA